ncbi:hypothetical protein [Carnimonas nigrificans]|uniref:hypothetical protein n=1 Tax=Carnimonas nigrificans TaxID=64323 RepID=UPI0004720353|nr:hypothetical protein [Carnimonas nigrificans]
MTSKPRSKSTAKRKPASSSRAKKPAPAAPRSRYKGLAIVFILVAAATAYLNSGSGSHGWQQGLENMLGYLPRYVIAALIAAAGGYLASLIGGKGRADKTFSISAVIIFLLVAALLVFKNGWVNDQLNGGHNGLSRWLGGSSSSTTHESTPSKPAPQAKPNAGSERPTASKPTPPASHNVDLGGWAQQVNKRLPSKVDQYTQLSKVIYAPKANKVSVNYDVDNFDSLGVDENDFVAKMAVNMKKEYCQGAFFKSARQQGASVEANYRYHYGGIIGSPITVKPSECR